MASGRGGKTPWQDNPALRADVPSAAALCGWTFEDELLAVVALHPHLVGFSRLEFLGDALLNLSIYTAASVVGVGRDLAVRAVANASLDARIGASPLASERRSGDVLEALVGAVHLEGGFAAAWVASLRIAAPAVGIPDGLGPPPDHAFGPCDRRTGAFVGSAVLGAVVADHLCRSEPTWSHDRYSDARSSLLGTARLAQLARRHLASLVDGHADGHADGLVDATCADVLQAAAAQRFFEGGWAAAAAAATEFGVLPG